MSDPNLKAMTQAELFKYLEEDFMPRLLPKLANVRNIEAENAHLKAEVERLTQNTDKLCKHGDIEIERLKAEVERLRKAGDAMAETLEAVGFDSAMDFWNAANREQGCLVNPIKVAQYLPKPPTKEGKQS